MPDPKRRYRSKLAHLIKQGWSHAAARVKAAGYAGGKTTKPKEDTDSSELGEDEVMPFSSTAELPESVRNALPAPAQKIWMEAFNAAAEDSANDGEAAEVAWSAVKEAGYEKGDGDKWVKASEPTKPTMFHFAEGELSHDKMHDMVHSALTANNPFVDIWIREMFSTYAIAQEWRSGMPRLYRVEYSIQDGKAVLGAVQEVSEKKTYEPIAACERASGIICLDEYVTELSSDTTDIEILRTGEWNHPEYGKIKVDESKIDGFIASFNARVRGVDLAIDQAHKPDEGAAGWIRSLFKQETDHGPALFARVEWTPLGKELIEAKIFRYISPEFAFAWKDEEKGGKEYSNVLFGAALTNRPFIKGMAPVIAASEDVMAQATAEEIAALAVRIMFSEDPPPKKKENRGGRPTMNLNEIVKVLGLKEGADDKAVMEAVKSLISASEASKNLSKISEALKLSEDATAEQVVEAITKLADKAGAVSDKDTQIVNLTEQNKVMVKRLQKLEEHNLQMEWNALEKTALSEGRLTPKMAPKLKERFMADPTGTRELIDLLEPVVALGERGSSQQTDSNIKVFESKINAYMSENKVDYGAALEAVALAEPALWNEVDRERRGA